MESIRFLKLAALVAFSVPPFARASDSVSVYQIAVTGMSVPGTGGTFTSFSAPTTNRDVDQNLLLNPFFFMATSSNGNSGVYAYDAVSGMYTDLADTTMAAGTGGNFANFSSLNSGEGSLGFIATDSNGAQGIYAEGYNALALVATPSTITESSVALGNIQNISVSGNPYGTPAGVMESDSGVYIFLTSASPDVPENINYASLNSYGPISFKGSLGNSNLPGIHLQAYAFAANAGAVRSIYFIGPGSGSGEIPLATIAGSIPSGTGTFTSFGNPVVTANEVAFTAHYSTSSGDQEGIFVYGGYIALPQNPGEDAKLTQVLATGQVAPDSHGATFTGFSDLTDSSYDQTFLASLSNGQEGLYVNVEEGPLSSNPPQLVKIAATGDLINGKTILGFELSPDASNYYELANYGNFSNIGTGFEVSFTDGSEGLYYFDINLPEPVSLALMGLPLLLMLRRR